MGDFHEHVVFGLLAASVSAYFFSEHLQLTQLEMFGTGIAVIIGSVLPDIDHKDAYAHRAAKAFSAVGAAVILMVYTSFPIHFKFAGSAGAFMFVFIGFSSIDFKHRGFTHSLSFMGIATLAAAVFSLFIFASFLPGIALGIGVLSHLTLDRHFELS